MRSCIYCGRELGKDEKCTCRQSVRARAAKQENTAGANKSEEEYEKYKRSQTGADRNKGTDSGSTAYHTGYTKKQTKWDRGSFKRKAKMNKDRAKESANDIKNSISHMVKSILLNPMDAVANSGYVSKAVIIVINIITGCALSLDVFMFLLKRYGHDAFSAKLAQYGYSFAAANPVFIITNAVVFTALVFLFQLVLYAFDKFVFRSRSGFWAFASRITAALSPFMISCAVGAAVGIFTIYATLMLIVTGSALSCILLYEALRNQWISLGRSTVFYITGIGIFIFTVICFNIFRILL